MPVQWSYHRSQTCKAATSDARKQASMVSAVKKRRRLSATPVGRHARSAWTIDLCTGSFSASGRPMTQDIARTQREKSPLSWRGESEATVPRANSRPYRDYLRTRGTAAHQVPCNGFERVPRYGFERVPRYGHQERKRLAHDAPGEDCAPVPPVLVPCSLTRAHRPDVLVESRRQVLHRGLEADLTQARDSLQPVPVGLLQHRRRGVV